jgi:hypothetical protein
MEKQRPNHIRYLCLSTDHDKKHQKNKAYIELKIAEVLSLKSLGGYRKQTTPDYMYTVML